MKCSDKGRQLVQGVWPVEEMDESSESILPNLVNISYFMSTRQTESTLEDYKEHSPKPENNSETKARH